MQLPVVVMVSLFKPTEPKNIELLVSSASKWFVSAAA